MVPAGRVDTLAFLQAECGTATSIKDAKVRKAVLRALRRIEVAVTTHRLPDAGLAVLASDDRVVLIEPELPVPARVYRCSKRFEVEMVRVLRRPPDDGPAWGWAHVSGTDVSFGVVGTSAVTRYRRAGGGVKRHRRGGQSSARFMRLFDAADEAWAKEVGEWLAARARERGLRHLFVGGPGVSVGGRLRWLCQVSCPTSSYPASGNPLEFGARVRTELVPAAERTDAARHERACWDLLQREPDRTRVGAAEVQRAVADGLAAKVWAEDGVALPLDADRVRMPAGSMARMGGALALLHWAVPLND